MADRELRSVFDEDAILYDQARPGYPAELFDDLASIAGLDSGARVLEIGPGTGQATRSLAERQYSITAVEIGPNLAAIARRNLAGFPNVSVVVTPFEDWPLPAMPFDAAVSATAFHWLDPAVRVSKVAGALRCGGYLALIGTHHVDGGTEQFFRDSQQCYVRWTDAKPGIRLPKETDVPQEDLELAPSGQFDTPVFRHYIWEREYSAAGYIDLLNTYSENRAMAKGPRQGLLDCIASLINERYGGHIRKRYLNQMMIARLRSASPRRIPT